MQDVTFIDRPLQAMTSSVQNKETLHKILGTANQYAMTMKFPLDKSVWTDEQLDKYLNMIEKLVDMPVEYQQEDFESMTILEKLESAGIKAEEKNAGPQTPEGLVGKVVEKWSNKINIEMTLKCPCPNKLMVWDNRKSKKVREEP